MDHIAQQLNIGSPDQWFGVGQLPDNEIASSLFKLYNGSVVKGYVL